MSGVNRPTNTGLMVTLCVFSLFFWTEGLENRFSLEDFGYLVFHSPYCKLVQKSLARLMLNDFLSHPSPNTETGPFTGLDAFRYAQQETQFRSFQETNLLNVGPVVLESRRVEGGL